MSKGTQEGVPPSMWAKLRQVWTWLFWVGNSIIESYKTAWFNEQHVLE